MGSMRISRSTPLVEAVSSHTMGLNMWEMVVMRPEIRSAILSGLRCATLLGTSSPNTRVK